MDFEKTLRITKSEIVCKPQRNVGVTFAQKLNRAVAVKESGPDQELPDLCSAFCDNGPLPRQELS